MKRNSLASFAAAVACVGMVLPPNALAVESPIARDIALQNGGLLVGQVVDAQGVVQANVPVSIQYGQQEVARTTTDANGIFAAQGLRGGQYEIITREGASVCRLWAPGTEPPAAQKAALVVSGENVVRGMPGAGPMKSWVNWCKCHPYITAGTVAAAVAIPLALADDDDSAS
jgi:hypothetical protein